MQCPNCGHENPSDAQRCGSCGLVLKIADLLQPTTKARTSKLAILSLVLGILSLPFFLLAGIPAIIVAIVSIIRIANSGGRLKGLPVALAGIIVSALSISVFALLWCLDAPPIPNDYTMSDIRSASVQYNQTYDLVRSLGDENKNLNGESVSGLSVDDAGQIVEIYDIFKQDDLQAIAEQLMQHEQEILSLWQKAQKGKDIFAELDSFAEIADLKQQSFEIDRPWIMGVGRMTLLHRAYACLQSCQGNHKTALDELTRSDSIVRKMSLTARSVLTKLSCLYWMSADIQAANFITNNPQTPHDVLLLLKQHASDLSNEHTALKNALVFDYLSLRDQLTDAASTLRLRFSAFSPLKLNSTLRLLRNFFDEFIALDGDRGRNERLRVWPTIYPNLLVSIAAERNLPWYYWLYNPTGSQVVELFRHAPDKLVAVRTQLEVHSDLLQIVLDKRLGKEVSLKARAYSEEYIVDVENKKIFSPGPDGKPGTKDDIKLPINPEVLGWNTR